MVDPSWHPVLARAATVLGEIIDLLNGKQFLPPVELVFRALTQPLDAVRVVIVGQDPYPTPGHAVGLSFSVPPALPPAALPPTLKNILREYRSDLRYPDPATGDLSPWAAQGVLLLNRVLTVRPQSPGSHAGIGWEAVTDVICQAVAARNVPLVPILWGRQAQELEPVFAVGGYPIIKTAHPSMHSAHRGFYGSRPFRQANFLLKMQGGEPVDWRLP